MLAPADPATPFNQILHHPHVLTVECVIREESVTYLGYPYLRTTMEDILNVHIDLGEEEIHIIATSVSGATMYVTRTDPSKLFNAVCHLYEEGFSHGSIDGCNVRVCSRSGRVKLGVLHVFILSIELIFH
jgi:hypothetical protein